MVFGTRALSKVQDHSTRQRRLIKVLAEPVINRQSMCCSYSSRWSFYQNGQTSITGFVFKTTQQSKASFLQDSLSKAKFPRFEPTRIYLGVCIHLVYTQPFFHREITLVSSCQFSCDSSCFGNHVFSERKELIPWRPLEKVKTFLHRLLSLSVSTKFTLTPVPPGGPCGPTSPVAPASPWGPGLPGAPVCPGMPCGPRSPRAPLGPGTPLCPCNR